VAYSPDGSQIAITAPAGNLQLLDRKTGAESAVSIRHCQLVTATSYSPCGRWLATGYGGGAIKLWDLQSGAELGSVVGHERFIRGVTFAPNGLKLVSWSSDRTACFWDTSSGKLEPAHAKTLDINAYPLVFSPCSTMIAWSDNDDGLGIPGVMLDIHIWDVKSQQELFVLKGHSDAVLCLTWSSDGILSGGQDEMVRLWKLQSTESTSTWTSVDVIRNMMGPLVCLAWNPIVPQEFVCGSLYSSLTVWRVTEAGGDEVDVRLKWGSVDRLQTSEAKITDAIDLDDMQRKLLQQGGAIDTRISDTTAGE